MRYRRTVGRVIDVARLNFLRAVVASGSVHAAARNLGYTPSTVSQHLRTLQRETGLTLFEKAGRGIAPTAAGLRLAREAEEILGGLDRLDAVVAGLRHGRSSSLAVACSASVAQAWVPSVAEGLARRFPDLVLEVSLNEPHGGTGRRPPDIDVRTEPLYEPPRQQDGFHRHPLREEAFRLVLPAGHPAAEHDEVSLAALATEAWIDIDIYESPTGRIVMQACRAAGFTPRYVARFDDHHAVMALVAAGIGVTVLPELALQTVPRGAVHVGLVNPSPRRQVVAMVRDSAAHLPAVRAGLELLEETARAWGARSGPDGS